MLSRRQPQESCVSSLSAVPSCQVEWYRAGSGVWESSEHSTCFLKYTVAFPSRCLPFCGPREGQWRVAETNPQGEDEETLASRGPCLTLDWRNPVGLSVPCAKTNRKNVEPPSAV